MSTLANLGIDETEEKIYRILLVSGQLSHGEIKVATSIDLNAIKSALETLKSKQLVREIPGVSNRYACLLPVGPLKDELLDSVTEIDVLGRELDSHSKQSIESLKTQLEADVTALNEKIDIQQQEFGQKEQKVRTTMSEKQDQIESRTQDRISELKSTQSEHLNSLKSSSITSSEMKLSEVKSSIKSTAQRIEEKTQVVNENQEQTKSQAKTDPPALDLTPIDNTKTEVIGKLEGMKATYNENLSNLESQINQSASSLETSYNQHITSLENLKTEFGNEIGELTGNLKSTINMAEEETQTDISTKKSSITTTINEKKTKLSGLESEVNTTIENVVAEIGLEKEEFDSFISSHTNALQNETDRVDRSVSELVSTVDTQINNQLEQVATQLDENVREESEKLKQMIQELANKLIEDSKAKLNDFTDSFTISLDNVKSQIKENHELRKDQLLSTVKSSTEELKSKTTAHKTERTNSVTDLFDSYTKSRNEEKTRINDLISEVLTTLDTLSGTIVGSLESYNQKLSSMKESSIAAVDQTQQNHDTILEEQFSQVLTSLTQSLNETMLNLKEINSVTKEDLSSSYETLNSQINNMIMTNISELKQQANEIYQTILKRLGTALESMHEKYISYVNSNRTDVDGAVQNVSTEIESLKSELNTIYSNSTESINSEFVQFYELIQNNSNQLLSFVNQEIADLLETFSGNVSSTYTEMKNLSQGGLDSQITTVKGAMDTFNAKYKQTTNTVSEKTKNLAGMLDNIFQIQQSTDTPNLKTTHIVGKSAILDHVNSIIGRVKSKVTLLVPSINMVPDAIIESMSRTSQVTIISYIDEVKDKNWIDKLHNASANVNIRALTTTGIGGNLPDFIGCEREGEEILLAAKDEATDDYIGITSLSEDFVQILGNIVISDYARGRSKQLSK